MLFSGSNNRPVRSCSTLCSNPEYISHFSSGGFSRGLGTLLTGVTCASEGPGSSPPGPDALSTLTSCVSASGCQSCPFSFLNMN